GGFLYTPAAGFSGSDSFTYAAVSNGLSSAPATVTIKVQPPTPAGSGTAAPPAPVTSNSAPSTGMATSGPPVTFSLQPDPHHHGNSLLAVRTTSGKYLIKLRLVHHGQQLQIDVSPLTGGHLHTHRIFVATSLSAVAIHGKRSDDQVKWIGNGR